MAISCHDIFLILPPITRQLVPQNLGKLLGKDGTKDLWQSDLSRLSEQKQLIVIKTAEIDILTSCIQNSLLRFMNPKLLKVTRLLFNSRQIISFNEFLFRSQATSFCQWMEICSTEQLESKAKKQLQIVDSMTVHLIRFTNDRTVEHKTGLFLFRKAVN